MLVYRVEHPAKENRGPYVVYPCRLNYRPGSQPIPGEDGIDYSKYQSWSQVNSHRHGFESIEKLKDWFDEWDRRILKEDGFVVNVYGLPEIAVTRGRKQLIFDVRQATFVETDMTVL